MSTRRYLAIHIERCTGCRTCEAVCSFRWEEVIRPSGAAITVVRASEHGPFVPVVCQQCERPWCVDVCQAGALKRNPETGAIVVDAERCRGCRLCMLACSLGGMGFDRLYGIARKCDLCGGDPLCVRFCPFDTLELLTDDQATLSGRRRAAERLLPAARGEVAP